MNLRDILKPKSPKQIISDFASEHNISVYKLEAFLNIFKKDRRIKLWILSFFIWVFALSMIISGILSLSEGFFWFPFDIVEKNNLMISFINIFWTISWFAISLFMIIYMIILLSNVYKKN